MSAHKEGEASGPRRFCHLCGNMTAQSSSFEAADFCYSCGASFRPSRRLRSTCDAAVQTDEVQTRKAPSDGMSTPKNKIDPPPSTVVWKVPPSSPFFDATMERALQTLFSIVNSDRLYYAIGRRREALDGGHTEGGAEGDEEDYERQQQPIISVHQALEGVADAHEAALRHVTMEHQNTARSLERQLRVAIERVELAEGDASIGRAKLQATEAEQRRVSALYEAQLARLSQELERVAEQEKRHQRELVAAQAAEVRAAWNLLMGNLDKDVIQL